MDSRCDDHQHMSRPAVVTSGGTVHLRCDMTRRDRIKRLAEVRGDRAALAILEGEEITRIVERAEDFQRKLTRRAMVDVAVLVANGATPSEAVDWTESELRALWGDR